MLAVGRETPATALLLVPICLAQTAVLTAVNGTAWLADGTSELHAIMTRVAYLLLTGFLPGWFHSSGRRTGVGARPHAGGTVYDRRTGAGRGCDAGSGVTRRAGARIEVVFREGGDD